MSEQASGTQNVLHIVWTAAPLSPDHLVPHTPVTQTRT